MSNNKHCDNCKYYQYINGKWDCNNKKSSFYNAHPNPIENCDLHSQKNAHTIDDLLEFQSYPLSIKIEMTKHRIREWINRFGEDGVYISFSGGKDSTVLLDLVRKDYPNVEAVFVDTGLEYPEIREFVKSFDNVTWMKPNMNFKKVIEKYGYPFFSKEISECIADSRKYIKILTDRQTDRQTDRWFRLRIG